MEASPFRLKYSLPKAIKSIEEEQMEEVTIVTLKFLGDVLEEVFEMADDKNIDFEYISGSRTDVSSDYQIFYYSVSAQFHEMSKIVPLMTDIDALFADVAFQAPANETLLILLKNLPASNPYSKTTEIYFGIVSESSTEDEGLGVTGIVSIASAFMVTLCITGVALAHRMGCTKERKRLRNKTFSITHATELTQQDSNIKGSARDYDYTSSLESSSLVDHKNLAEDRDGDQWDSKNDNEEEINFENAQRLRKAEYVAPEGLFDAPFESKKYAEIPKRDEV